jgi:hypothetical protein
MMLDSLSYWLLGTIDVVLIFALAVAGLCLALQRVVRIDIDWVTTIFVASAASLAGGYYLAFVWSNDALFNTLFFAPQLLILGLMAIGLLAIGLLAKNWVQNERAPLSALKWGALFAVLGHGWTRLVLDSVAGWRS